MIALFTVNRGGVLLHQLREVRALLECVKDFVRIRRESVRRQLKWSLHALFQVLDVDLSGNRVTLAYREIDDEFGVGVNAKINVLLAALAVFQFVVSFLATDKGKQFVNLHVWKGNVANALV